MRIKSINKRLMAGMLGGVMLTTPLTFTACSSSPYEYVTDTDGSVKLNSDKKYSHNDVKDLRIINVKTKINENIYLVYVDSYFFTGIPMGYYDVFTGRAIIHNNLNGDVTTEGVELLSAESVEQYLISYDMLKENYSVEDLEFLLEKIKQDVYSDTFNKELVKNK